MNNSYLFDRSFLEELAIQKNKIIYIKIILLNLNEDPLEQIEGVVNSGSINIDDESIVRRTCNITLLSNELNINSFLWGLNSRFKVEIGLENFVSNNYPKICWFKQGTFLITSFSISNTTNAFQISISGQDKMVLLNGDVSGTLQASTVFDTIEKEDEYGNIIYEKVPLQTLIKEAVHKYGQEPYSNIIINDLDDCGFELLEYCGNKNMFIMGPADTFLLAGKDTIQFSGEVYRKNGELINLTNSEDIAKINFYPLYDKDFTISDSEVDVLYPTSDCVEGTELYIAKIDGGSRQAVGYRKTDLVYAGDLIANVGEALTSILDKIKKQLGLFEYFYDLDGHFVFQKKPYYLSVVTEAQNKKNFYGITEPVFRFFNGNLITNIANAPNFSDIKNDYTIWGTKKSASGADIPIWCRYAIDEKPIEYNSPWGRYLSFRKKQFENVIKDDNNKAVVQGLDDKIVPIYVWSDAEKAMTQPLYEIYEALSDEYIVFLKGEEDDKEELKNWREIIYNMAIDYNRYHTRDDFLIEIMKHNANMPNGITGYEQYYIEILEFFNSYPKLEDESEELSIYNKETDVATLVTYTATQFKDIAPEDRTVWFDFIEPKGDLAEFSVRAIGQRNKAVNDSQVKVIGYKNIPNLLFFDSSDNNFYSENEEIIGAYSFIQIPNQYDSFFSISDRGKSAKDAVDEYLNTYTYPNNSITLTTLPIYWLEPNNKIYVQDKDSHIDAEYIITKITIPLNHNGTTSIIASRTIDDII